MRTVLKLSLFVICWVLSSRSVAQNASAKEIYDRGLSEFTGGPQSRNDMRAADDVRRAAEMGYVPAQFTLGYILETGTYLSGGLNDAVTWYAKAAEQGDRLAQWNLGRCYYKGTGVPVDLDKAQLWLKRAADQGDPFGQYLLARVKQDRSDYEQALLLYEQAARQGLPQAQVRFARMLSEGPGAGKVDRYQAYVWFLVAMNAGDNSASVQLSQLEGALGTTQVEKGKSEAQALIRETSRAAIAKGCTGWTGEFDPTPQPPPITIQQFCR